MSGVPGSLASVEHADLLRAVYDESPVAILLARQVDGRASTILDANPAAAALLERPVTALRGTDVRDILVEGQPLDLGGAAGSARAVRVAASGEPDRAGDGPGNRSSVGWISGPPAPDRWLAVSITGLSQAAGGPELVLVMLHDVTAHHRIEERLDRAARHDPLTGLANRAELLRILGSLDPAEDGPHVAVVFLDLDGFKLVNDTRGHAVGDELLVAVAERIRGAIRAHDTLARFGGDEFVILCPRLSEPMDARVVAERVRATLEHPLTIGGRAHRITTSVGMAWCAADEVDPQDLLRRADMAMYRAKDSGRNRVRLHSVEMDAELAAAERIRETLEVALAEPAAMDPTSAPEHLLLHFQPIVEIETGRLAYVEALARLSLADGRLVYPTEFLPVAARAGLNGALSEGVLRLALRQRARWRADGVDVPIGLNLTRGQVFSASFAGEALAIVAAEGDQPSRVVFEMDEFGLLEATGPAQLTLRRLRASGIGLAVDHFGTGYSSLGALRFLGPNRVKIDRSFVASISANPADRAIVTAAISAAHALGQRVVAEGVETRDQLAVLEELGCDEAQGFLIERVLPAAELDLPLLSWRPGTLEPGAG